MYKISKIKTCVEIYTRYNLEKHKNETHRNYFCN